jgi:hypothetical protein
MRFTGGSMVRPERTCFGMKSNIRESIRITASGACAALANVLITWPAVSGFGSVRWKACPSSPSMWAMWSIALATKSTGTMLIFRPSMPTPGNHWGTALRARCSSLKK